MARTDNWWPGRATRILGAGGPNWPERLKKPAGQRASAYVEGWMGVVSGAGRGGDGRGEWGGAGWRWAW